MLKYKTHIIFLFALLICLSNGDTTSVQQIAVSLVPDDIDLPTGLSQEISFGSIRHLFFFDSRAVKLSEADLSALDNIGVTLQQNPSAELVLKGYYSPEYDDILSPQAGIELSNNRAENILNKLSQMFPVIGDRIIIHDTHDVSAPFFPDSTTHMDMRVSCDVLFSGFEKRNFYPANRFPYWRQSYKQIIADIAPKINNVLSSNPDAMAIIVGYGFKNNSNGYKWLDYLRKKLSEQLDKTFLDDVILFVNPVEKPKTPFAQVLLVPRQMTPLGIILQKWVGSKEFLPEVRCTVENLELLPNIYYCNIRLPENSISFTYPIKSSNQMLTLDEIPLLPGKYSFSFFFPGIGRTRRAVVLSADIGDSFSGTWEIPLWLTIGGKINPADGAGIWFVAKTIMYLARIGFNTKISISSNNRDEQIALNNSQLLWHSLEAVLSFMTETDDNEIGKWLKKHNVDVEISSSGYIEEEFGLRPEIAENMSRIVVQFSSRER